MCGIDINYVTATTIPVSSLSLRDRSALTKASASDNERKPSRRVAATESAEVNTIINLFSTSDDIAQYMVTIVQDINHIAPRTPSLLCLPPAFAYGMFSVSVVDRRTDERNTRKDPIDDVQSHVHQRHGIK